MNLIHTPNANRLHIALFGKRNSGKSSLINALTGQDTALISDTPGTTTDPVQKAMEIHGIGPCLFIDTPGFDDEGELGNRRIERTWKAVEKTDIALLLCAGGGSAAEETGEPDFTEELHWLEQLKAKNIPTILLINKADIRKDTVSLAIRIKETFGSQPIPVSAKEKTGVELIRQAILEKLPEDFDQQSITGSLVTEGDLVLLVMPQDIQAPKGRLILPQVQTMRELLDKKCLIMSCTTDKLRETLQALSRPPKLIITDSQVFKTVYEQKPEESRLTSFSVLFAGYKGDIRYYVKSASAIGSLTESSRVLIAEACTHAPLSEDIGRVKLPHLLRKRIGEKLSIDIVAGTDFPQDLTPYSLVIHCGACMFNRKYVLNRIERARLQNVPMTNYGVAIAFLNGILNQIEY
ncbi:[FeFe] hydrogenase H-cluster maturation GTPase HydF [Bacteroides thetaiotaomicron]|uniref:[FeFe] hydrogenase H-cluster maturation GTPase HydF n=1 Tax=Bacteroides thetaiotaomicron TaxID=818 RepID=UPI0039C3E954